MSSTCTRFGRTWYRFDAVVLGALVLGCTLVDRGSEAPATDDGNLPPMLQNEHGFEHGTVVSPVELPCTDGARHVIGSRDSTWVLITFTTPGDCSLCQPHLAGLAALDSAKRLPVQHVFVAYPAGMDLEAARRQYALVTSRPVCWDEGGRLWDAHAISHTPVTVLVNRGRVVLMHDAPLATEASRQQLVNAVAAAAAERQSREARRAITDHQSSRRNP